MENKVKAMIISFDRVTMNNKKTGEVSEMLKVNFGVETAPIKNHYGLVNLTSYCSSDVFDRLSQNLGKFVEITLEDKPVFGKENTYKKIVTSISGVKVRNF